MAKKETLMVMALAAMTLASCGGSAASETASTPDESADTSAETGTITEDVTITFWQNMNDANKKVLQGIIDGFKEVEPHITVSLVDVDGGYDTILTNTETGISANNYPDIFYGYPDSIQKLTTYGKVVNLEPYIDNAEYGWTAEEKDDIVPAYLAEGESYPMEGIYSLPFSKSTEAMWYSQKLIGLTLEGVNGGSPLTEDYFTNLTWEELFDVLCPALETYNNSLTDDAKLYAPAADGKSGIVGYDSDANMIITLCEQYGYAYTSVDKTLGTGKLDFYEDETARSNIAALMVKFNGYVNSGYLCTGGTTGLGYTNSYTTGGNALFAIGSTAGLKYQYASEYYPHICKLPTAEGQDKKVINQGPSVAVLSHPDASGTGIDETRVLASWLFYRYLTNEENATAWAIDTDYLPIRESVFETDAWAEYSTIPDNRASSEGMSAEKTNYVETISEDLYASAVFTGSSTARTEIGGAWTQALVAGTELTSESAVALLKTAYENALKDVK